MKILVSVLMSIYNEEEREIKLAIESILNQSYKNIEFIIINDNPERDGITKLIERYQDKRIVYHKNEQNIGLAMSMNVAAELATGKYLARMDADDISYLNRIEKEVNFLQNNSVDYVCTYYEFIDEKDKRINKSFRKFKEKTVNAMLPFSNTIHHPTVMMKREIFEIVGGYRDFPCAQDYDLWLRFWSEGFVVGIVEEVMFAYRIRSESITNKKYLQQVYTQLYARKLLNERRKTGKDTYSNENYINYLKKNGVFNNKYVKKIQMLENEKKKRGKEYIPILFISDKFYRRYYINAVRSRVIEYLLLK